MEFRQHCHERKTSYSSKRVHQKWKKNSAILTNNNNKKNPQWDLAIIKLASPVKLSTFLQVACLPTTISTSYPALGSSTVILGWGTVKGGGSTHVLQIGDTNVVDSDLMYFSTFGSQYQCYGDSGGPSFQLSTIGEKLKYGSFDLDPVIHGQQRSAFRINTWDCCKQWISSLLFFYNRVHRTIWKWSKQTVANKRVWS